MGRKWFVGAVLALAMSVGLGAQHRQHTRTPAVVTGCLAPLVQTGSAVAGTTGTTAATTSKKSRHATEQFTLINPQMGPAATSSNGDVAPSADQKVLLEGRNLRKYQGHTVEVRGSWVRGHAKEGQHPDDMRIFRVASITNVGGNCSTSGR